MSWSEAVWVEVEVDVAIVGATGFLEGEYFVGFGSVFPFWKEVFVCLGM